MKLDELPSELLIEIFSHLRTCKKVSLVSRRFYEIACEINDKNFFLILDRHLWAAENLPQLQSIERSNRKISKVEICCYLLTEDGLRTLLSIVSKFKETIKYLALIRGSIDMASFLEIVSSVPNAEYLCFHDLKVSHPVKMSSTEDLNLNYLKTLDISECGIEIQVVFNRLPAGVLTELFLPEAFLLSLDTLFTRQTNLKNLSVAYSYDQFRSHIFDNLELNSLDVSGTDIDLTTLCRQTKLKSLTLNGTPRVNGHLMGVITNSLTDLEKLDWHITTTPVIDFVNIKRLKNLKHLRLDFGHSRPDIVDVLVKLDNSRIDSLEIFNFRFVTNHQIQLLAKSAPKLKVVKICGSLPRDRTIAVLMHFNFVECLSFGRFSCDGNYENYLMQNESANTMLSELSFSVTKYRRLVLRKMIADFPNLKKLKIVSGNDLTSSHFRLIRDGFAKLESLDLYQGKQLTIDDFKYLRDHRKCFQTLWLRQLSDVFLDRHLADLEAMFEVVKYSPKIFPSSLLLKM